MDGLSEFSWQNIKCNFYTTGALPELVERDSPILQAWEVVSSSGS